MPDTSTNRTAALRPKSLLEMAGAPLHPSPLDKSVLVIVDAQLEYVTGGLPLIGVAPAIAEARRVLDLARAAGMPVFHVVQHSAPGRPLFDPTGPTAAIVPELTPVDGEATVVKKLPNSFAGTDLDSAIRATGRSEIILVGFMTHMCISATARAALDLGYRTTIVAGAAATRDLPNPLPSASDTAIPAEVVHRTALAELADRFAIVVPEADSFITS